MSESMVQLEKSWQELRLLVNRRLEEYMRQGPDCPTKLSEAMRYSLLSSGKRLRPVLLLLSCDACGGSMDSAMPAACAIEMVHTYSLIHDDLPAMDNDKLRRGRPTNHVVFDEATAILAGDGLLTLAFEMIASKLRPPAVAAACCVDLARAAGVSGMVGGQVADLQSEQLLPAGDLVELERRIWLKQLQSVHERKTGRLIRSALTMGARIAGTDAQTNEMLEKYGKAVGLAFQITDDLLDLTGTEEEIGKGVGKDACLGKLTYPGLLGPDGARAKARELIDTACGSIAPLGDRGQRLEALAVFVLEREH